MKKPRTGMTVLFFPKSDDSVAKSNSNNGPIASIITQVWSDVCVNLKIMPDCGPIQDRTSVTHKSMNPATYSWCYLDEVDDYFSGQGAGVATIQA